MEDFSPELLAWYEKNARELPWRQDITPYRVWVSEIMLQQTRIEAARGYFQRFMAALPTVEALAGAEEDTVLKLWEGLGYYSRARNLHACAKMLVEEYGGVFPRSAEELRALPGIGDYTAGAIASIAFGLPEPAVDGNVLRVLARLSRFSQCEVPLSGGAARHLPGGTLRRLHQRPDGAGRDGLHPRGAGLRTLPPGGALSGPRRGGRASLPRPAGKKAPAYRGAAGTAAALR